MKRTLLWLIPLTLLLTSCAKLVVVQVPGPKGESVKAEGIFYALPKTVTRVAVNVDRVEKKSAPYVQFSRIFDPDDAPDCMNVDCSDQNKVSYSIENNAAFTTFGEPDPANVYMVKFVGKGAVDQTISMAWTDTGLLSTASASVTNRTADVVISGLKLAASLGAKAAFAASAKIATAAPGQSCPKPSANDSWILSRLRAPGVPTATGDVLIGNFCEIKVADPKTPKDPVKDTIADRSGQAYEATDGNQALLDDALGAYVRHVAPLADARARLLSGNSTSFEPTELVTKIETLLALQMKALYAVNKSPVTWAGSVDIRAIPAPGSQTTVFHLDPAKGICVGDGSGSPDVSISTDAKPLPDGFGQLLTGTGCTGAPVVALTTTFSPASQLFQSVQDHTTLPTADLSFRYRIPAQIRAELKQGDTSYGLGVFSVAQLGVVRALPAKRNSKAISYDLAMVEATGGLKSFKIGTTGAADSGTVDALAGIGGTLLDARNASDKADKTAAQTAQDPATALTKQDTLLKLKDDICTIQKKYGLDCTIQP